MQNGTWLAMVPQDLPLTVEWAEIRCIFRWQMEHKKERNPGIEHGFYPFWHYLLIAHACSFHINTLISFFITELFRLVDI